MGDPQDPFRVALDPRVRLLKPARMVLDEYAMREGGEAGADNTEAGRMAQRIEDAIGHSVTDVQPTVEWQERVAAWETSVTAAAEAMARVRKVADAYENYAVVCDRDAETGSSDSPTRQHWRREADYARLAARRIRHALGD